MTAAQVLAQNNGEVTKAYYDDLQRRGILGYIGVALLRAQKRSSRAKEYRSGKFRAAAYDVKEWSLGIICQLLAQNQNLGFAYGWKPDPSVPFGSEPSHVLYVDIPDFGQASFHSPSRGIGPAYAGQWSGLHNSPEIICAFCDSVMVMGSVAAETQVSAPGVRNAQPEPTATEKVAVPAPAQPPHVPVCSYCGDTKEVAESSGRYMPCPSCCGGAPPVTSAPPTPPPTTSPVRLQFGDPVAIALSRSRGFRRSMRNVRNSVLGRR